MTPIRAAFFAKNLPGWERVLRITVAVAAVLVCLILLPVPWSWLLASAAAGFGVTGLVGFCPACALAGRPLRERE